MAEQMDLEERLSSLAGAMAWPAEPDMRAAVRHRVSMRRPWYGGRWALAAIAVILALATLAAYAPTRTAIADWLNLHTSIKGTTSLATPSPLQPGPLGRNLGLGSPTTLQAARKGVAWAVLVPSQLGPPDETYLQNPPDGPSQGEVSLVYATRPDIPVAGQTGVSVLITEARGRVDANFFGKTIGPGTTIEPVTVGGLSGWWIAGQPHTVLFDDADGNPRFETLRLATNTMIIDDGGTIIRIEGDLTKQQALAIAASLS